MMVQLKCEQEFTLKLEEDVEKFSCLYNYKLAEYARKDLTEKAWEEVEKEVNDTVAKCKQKRQNVRTVFVRNLKPAANGSQAKSKKNRTNTPDSETQGNIPSACHQGMESDDENLDDNIELNNSELVDIESKLESQRQTKNEDTTKTSKTTGNDKPKIRKITENKAIQRQREWPDVDKTFLEFCVSRKKKTDDDDPNTMFLLSLLPEVNAMNAFQVRRFKREVLGFIDKVLEDIPVSGSPNNRNSWSASINRFLSPPAPSYSGSENSWPARTTNRSMPSPALSPTYSEHSWPTRTNPSITL